MSPLSYKFERIEVLPHATALKLGAKRGKGRPKNFNMKANKNDFESVFQKFCF